MAQCLKEMQNNYCYRIKKTTGYKEDYSPNRKKNLTGEQGGKALPHTNENMQQKDISSIGRNT